MKIKSVEPCYTGGNIYVFTGSLNDGTFFLASDDMYDVTIIDTDPSKADWDNEVFDMDWIESHLVKYLPDCTSDDTTGIKFFIDILDWVIKNNPKGNYQMSDIKSILTDVKEYLDWLLSDIIV